MPPYEALKSVYIHSAINAFLLIGLSCEQNEPLIIKRIDQTSP
ncbi:hypothetical protein MARI_23840 [Marinobacter sp. JH2]|nr:hypothetical protein MARI_23840 [Marinobacter sp. JH2]